MSINVVKFIMKKLLFTMAIGMIKIKIKNAT